MKIRTLYMFTLFFGFALVTSNILSCGKEGCTGHDEKERPTREKPERSEKPTREKPERPEKPTREKNTK